MARDTIEIRGLDTVIRKTKIMGQNIRPMIVSTTGKATKLVWDKLPDYPAEPPMSTYVRTGTLGRSIVDEVKPVGGGAVGTVGTNLDYAPWVISDEAVGNRGPQAEIHEERWWTLQGEFAKRKSDILDLFEEMMSKLKRRF